ncbi:MAG TPA: RluA family pseudouridine synthase, partial [Candidatus Saccharimonadia bacterium]|nr:RluA family pseudouridine synthase [Candidatus Saccharimonadia bacterium]
TKASQTIHINDVISIDFDFSKLPSETDLNIDIIYEDQDCLVIDKPIGILSHSKGSYNPETTVESFIASKTQDIKNSRPGIVHRLDRATSGVMICAKTEECQLWLQKQFSERSVRKIYYAIINGILKPESAILELPIYRNPKNPATFKVDSKGKMAITKYSVTKSNQKYSLIKLEPFTGRTHQLRVHLKYLKHPIVGDTFYNGEKASRLYLHASELDITLINGVKRSFKSKLPEEFDILLSKG